MKYYERKKRESANYVSETKRPQPVSLKRIENRIWFDFGYVAVSCGQNRKNQVKAYVQRARTSRRPCVVIKPTYLAKTASGDALISSDGARHYQGDVPTPQAVVGKGVYEGGVLTGCAW